MAQFFIAIYRYFDRKKWLMYTILALTSAIFIFFGLQVDYEEDISKLLPQTDAATESGLAFQDLRVKDKIFLQFQSKSGETSPEQLAAACDAFVEHLLESDSVTNYIENVLYRLDDDVLVMALDHVLSTLPTWVDTTLYADFPALLTSDAIDSQMAENQQLVAKDETGDLSQMVSQDPLALRKVFLEKNSQIGTDLSGGFAMVDRHFFSPDSTVALAFLSPNFQAFDSKTGTYLVELFEDEIEIFAENNPDVEVLFHGAPVQSVFNSRQTKKDLLLTIGLSLVVICLVIGLCFQTKRSLILLLLPVAYGTFFSLACMFWIKGGMSLLAIGIGAIVLGVALSYCLHIQTHSKYVSDPIQLLRDQAKPVCLGCLTTIGAFAGLLFTQSDLLKDFGLFASFALIGTTLFALIFLPHFFGKNQTAHSENGFAILSKINNFPIDRKLWLIVLIALISVSSFYFSTWIEFDSDLKNIGYNEPKVLRAEKLYADRNNFGNFAMYYAAAAPDLDSALIFSRNIAAVCDSLKRGGLIFRYSDVSSVLLADSEQQVRIDAWKNFWTEEKIVNVRNNIEKSAKKCDFAPEIFDPFFAIVEADYEPTSLIDAGVLPESLLSNFVEQTAGGYMVFTSVLLPIEHLNRVNDAIASVPHAVVIDPFYYTSDMVKLVNDDFNIVLLISSIFVFIVLLISFRSLLKALIAFLPMFLSWYIVQGVMGVCGLQFNLINIVISSFIFGVGVDYSIFVMDGLVANSRGENSQLLSFHKTAILFSAFVLIVVVTSLLFATHPALKSVGTSTLIGMTSTVLITYTLQPFLYRLLFKR